VHTQPPYKDENILWLLGTRFGDAPNANTCRYASVSGTVPVLNKRAWNWDAGALALTDGA